MLIILVLILVGQVSSQVGGVSKLDLKGWEINIAMTFDLIAKNLELLHKRGAIPTNGSTEYDFYFEDFDTPIKRPLPLEVEFGPPKIMPYNVSNHVRLFIPIVSGWMELPRKPVDLSGIELQIVAKLSAQLRNITDKGMDLYDIIIDVVGDDAVFQLNTTDGVDLEKKGLEKNPQNYLKAGLEKYIKNEVKAGKTYKIREIEV